MFSAGLEGFPIVDDARRVSHWCRVWSLAENGNSGRGGSRTGADEMLIQESRDLRVGVEAILQLGEAVSLILI